MPAPFISDISTFISNPLLWASGVEEAFSQFTVAAAAAAAAQAKMLKPSLYSYTVQYSK